MTIAATQAYVATKPITAPVPGADSDTPVTNAANSFLETLRASESASINAMQGNGDPHALVQAIAQTELAVETAVTIRNKVVEAYQEILRMPI